MAKCGTDPRQRFNLVLLPRDAWDNEEIFMVHIPSKGSCLELNDRSIFQRPCNPRNPLQQWKAINGNLTGRRFEMVPLTQTTHCVTQDHHPKPGEVVETFRCDVARRPTHLTSFRNLYGLFEQIRHELSVCLFKKPTRNAVIMRLLKLLEAIGASKVGVGLSLVLAIGTIRAYAVATLTTWTWLAVLLHFSCC